MTESDHQQESPEHLMEILEASDKPPDATLTQFDDQPQEIARRYNEDLEQGVHSYSSLQSSRDYVRVLLGSLPDEKKSETTLKCVDQELKLQESIRLQSYSDSEFQWNMMRLLTQIYGFGTPVSALLILAWPTLNHLFHLPFDAELHRTYMEFVKWAMIGEAGIIISYFFRRTKKK